MYPIQIEGIANIAFILAFDNKEPTPTLRLDNNNNISSNSDVKYIEDDNLLITADPSHCKWGYCTTTTQVPLNDIEDSDANSVQSKNNSEDTVCLDEALDKVVKVLLRKKLTHASDFLMVLYLWCKKKNIRQQTFDYLREVLVLVDHPHIQEIPNRLATLQSRCRRQLSIWYLQWWAIAGRIFNQIHLQSSDNCATIRYWISKKGRLMSRRYLVHWVYNLQTKDIRPIDLLSPIRIKLEIEAFGHEYLASQLVANVKSFPIIIFIDDFKLYRNMYCSLTGVYAIPAALSTINRQKSSNAHTLTLGPHGSNFNMVLSCLQTSLRALDCGKLVEING